MHLLIASVSAATSPTGICRHAANIVRGMLALPSVQKITILTGDWQADYFRDAFGLHSDRLKIRGVAISNRSIARNLWYLRDLPAVARECHADIVHLAYPIPIIRSAYDAPVIVSLHDLYPFDIPQNFGRRAWLNRAALRLCLRNVDVAACVSEETRTRVRELFPAMASEKTAVVPNSIYLSHELLPAALPIYLRDSPFFLCVAQHRANKNLPLLFRSLRLALDRNIVPANTRLVVVGAEGPETPHLYRVIAKRDLAHSVVLLKGISDTLLLSLYANCQVVVAPSLTEGFGLPVAEALNAGCRVVCSAIPAFRSIGAARCIFFDPEDGSSESLLIALQHALKVPRGGKASPVGLEPHQAAAMYFSLYSSLLQRKQTSVAEPLIQCGGKEYGRT
jgi:glycosyltransferase involved in cell wall biosynthesis